MEARSGLPALYTLSHFGATSLPLHETFTGAIYVKYELAFDRSLAVNLLLSPIGFRTLATSTWPATEGGCFGRIASSALPRVVVSSVLMAFFLLREPGGVR